MLGYNSKKNYSMGHWDTIYPYYFRRVNPADYTRSRIQTPDDDFIDLDWVNKDSDELLILSHGLESNSQAKYIQGMIHAFKNENMDALAWNCRGCSGEVNKNLIYYHSGASYDLDTVIEHVISLNKYKKIYLVGFSMGGNITLKYLGEKGSNVPTEIVKAMAISTPVDLKSSSIELAKGFGKIYSKNFIITLKKKIEKKQHLLDEIGITADKFNGVKTLIDFDHLYTAPLHGYKDAWDYYEKASSLKLLESIKVPSLIVNAANDPFLGDGCYPIDLVKGLKNVDIEVPKRGGHVGFKVKSLNDLFYSEVRAFEFFKS